MNNCTGNDAEQHKKRENGKKCQNSTQLKFNFKSILLTFPRQKP